MKRRSSALLLALSAMQFGDDSITLAMLQGRDAETFLAAQDVRWWCER